MTKRLFCTVVACFLYFQSLVAMSASGPLRVHPDNPRYFTDDSGEAIFLTGSHTWNNLRDHGTSYPLVLFDYEAYLSFLEAHGHNFIRLWTRALASFVFEGTTYYADPFPWQRTGPGNANDGRLKFDLSRFDQSYFDRMRQRIIEAGNRGMYVSIMLFDGYQNQFRESATDGFPFDGTNNINGVDAPGISANTLDHPAVTAYQEAYVRKVVDTVNDLDNVLYEVANEAGPYSTQWQYHMIRVIKAYQAAKPEQHPVGMTFQYVGGSNSELFSSEADWISPNEEGGYRDDPPVATGAKVIISDTDHLWGHTGGDVAWAWKSFARGLNTLFMDFPIAFGFPPPSDWREPVRRAMGHTLAYANRIALANVRPQSSLSACSTRYCLTDPGRQYLIYQPGSGTFSVDLLAGTYGYEWFDPSTGSVAETGTLVTAAGSRSFTPPFSGSAVLFLDNPVEPAARPAAPQNLVVR